jgi:pimeloyl-ACP methyl ester carboxylesterase
MASITNIILYVFLALSGIFYLTGVNEAKHTEQILKSRGSDLSPAHRGIAGEYLKNMAHMWFHYRFWLPNGKITGLVFIAHGFASHSGRYEALAQRLNQEGFAVFAHDNIGFGKSEGDRGHVEDWIYLVDDQLQFIEAMTEKYPKKPVFLLGESIGALTQILSVQKKNRRLISMGSFWRIFHFCTNWNYPLLWNTVFSS